MREKLWLAMILGWAGLVFGGAIGISEAAEPTEIFYRIGNFELLGDSPHYLEPGIGAFDFNTEGDGEESAAAKVDLRFGKKFYFVGPALGLMANIDGGVFGYGGLYFDLVYRKFVATPLLGLGGYHQGDSKDLGGIFQFRSAMTIAYQLDARSRLGFHVGHISNRKIHDDNPGEEEIYLTYAFSF